MSRLKLLQIILVLVLAIAVMIRVDEHRAQSERARTAVVALQLSNVIAERDSTRNVAAENRRVAALLADSLRIVEKRVVQVAQRADALDQAMGRERVARYALDATIDSLRRSVKGPVVERPGRDVRAATFDIRQVPYTVHAEVAIPRPPDSATMMVRVALDPVHVEVRLTCSPPNADGVRTASLVAATPPWVAVRLGRLEQSPEVCASPALVSSGRRLLTFKPLVIGVGQVVTPNGRWSWGGLIGVGLVVRL